MDWIQVLVILIGFGAGFGFLFNKIEKVKDDLTKEIQNVRNEMQEIKSELTKEIQNVRNEMQEIKSELTKEIQKNREDILWLKFRMDPYEHPDWRKELKKKTKENNKEIFEK